MKEPIAIVGIGCRFPGGASSPKAFWNMLKRGKDAIIDVPKERWDPRRFYDEDPDKPGKTYVKQGGFLKEKIDRFDPLFFGISPREAESMDPQQRLLLEVTWEAFEDAGLTMENIRGSRTGVFIGGFCLDSMLLRLGPLNRELADSHSAASSTMTILSNRISYVFDLKGPSLTMDTACSSSLVSTHFACQSLWSGESDTALSGGVNVMLRPEFPIMMSKGKFLSPHGRCKTFDADAAGYSRGEGSGIVVLKTLSKAQADGDRIYGLIKETGVNQDGHTAGISLPNSEAQEELARDVYRKAGVCPSLIDYVEAHGTGTQAGDPAELTALDRVLREKRSSETKCLVGSVKTNIGHLEASAGVAGLIKAALSLYHETIVANLHFKNPNPKIPFDDLCIEVSTKKKAWNRSDRPRYAGVNSFGYGGTNAHALLQEAPLEAAEDSEESEEWSRPYILPISGKSEAAVRELAGKYSFWLTTNIDKRSLRDFCLTTTRRRTHHSHRIAITAESIEAMREKMQQYSVGEPVQGIVEGVAEVDVTPPLIFIFTGMGPQWWAMGRELFEKEPVFRKVLEECDRLFKIESGWSILKEMLQEESNSRMARTEVAQPANFLIQAGLTALWKSWGIEPDAVIGHSVGEVGSAYVSGALSLEDSIKVSYHRSRLQQKLAGKGAMLAVGLSESEALARIANYKKVSVAAINAPNAITLSGDSEQLDEIAAELRNDMIFNKKLAVEVAYHSPQMDAIEDEIIDALASISPKKTRVPLYSTVTGSLIEGTEFGAHYWWRNVREPVRFSDGIKGILDSGYDQFVEIGPHPVLGHSVKEIALRNSSKVVLTPSLNRKSPEQQRMLESLGQLYVRGSSISWNRLIPEKGAHVTLPTYPWQRDVYWRESQESRQDRLGAGELIFLNQSMAAPQPAWSVEVNDQFFPFLNDHIVNGQVVFPGAGYVEGGLSVSRELWGEGTYVLRDLEFRNMLLVEAKKVQELRSVFNPHDNRYSIFSRTREDGEEWTLNATGTLVHLSGSVDKKKVDLDSLRDEFVDEMMADSMYAMLKGRGLQYGKRFKCAKRVWTKSDEVLVRIQKNGGLTGEANDFVLHPEILDSAFHSILTIVEGDRPYVPVSLKKVVFHKRLENECWFHGIVFERDSSSLHADIYLIDDAGDICVEIRDAYMMALPNTAGSDRMKMGQLFYAPEWESYAYRENKELSNINDFIVFSDGNELSDFTVNQLNSLGKKVSCFDCREKPNADSGVFVDPMSSDSFESALRPFVNVDGVHILYLRPIEDEEAEADFDKIQTGCEALTYLVQALTKLDLKCTLTIATAGGQRVKNGELGSNLNASPLWGFGPVIENECERIVCRLIDFQVNSLIPENVDWFNCFIKSDVRELAFRTGEIYSRKLNRVELDTDDSNEGELVYLSTDDPFELRQLSTNQVESIEYIATERISLGEGEVEVKVSSISLTRQEPSKDNLESSLLGGKIGVEVSGKVVSVGMNVDEKCLGKTVLFKLCSPLRRFLNTTYDQLVFTAESEENPNQFAFGDFAAAYYALVKRGQLSRGERVLIHDAATAVGLASIQIAQEFETEIFVTGKSHEALEHLRSISGIFVLDSRKLDFSNDILNKTDRSGVDLVLNTLSGDGLSETFAAMGACSRCIDISISNGEVLPFEKLGRNASYSRVDFEDAMRRSFFEGVEVVEEILQKLGKGVYVPLLSRRYQATEIKEAVRTLQNESDIGRVIVDFSNQVIEGRSDSKSGGADYRGTYIVTGGNGGFGFEVAKHLAQTGVERLVLLSRSGGLSEESKELLKGESEGALEVLSVALDVTDGDLVNELIQRIHASGPPIRGVVHGAMVLDDRFLIELDSASFKTVLEPKVKGALNLAAATKQIELDAFVSFSSIASVIGNRGQCNYIAANAFLDAFSQSKSEVGSVFKTINWGVLAESGIVARNEKIGAALEKEGIRGLSNTQALRAFDLVIRSKRSQVGVFDVDWVKWAKANPNVSNSSRIASLVDIDETDGKEGKSDLIAKELLNRDKSSQYEYIEGLVKNGLGLVLKLPVEKIDTNQTLSSLGIDSLLLIELTLTIQDEFGINIPAAELMKYPTVQRLTENIIARFGA